MKVLLSAYACEPNKGSEPGVGWNWALEIASLGHNVWVLTRMNNRETIEAELAKLPPFGSLQFVYYDLPKRAGWWKKGNRGINLYYLLWQWGAYRLAVKIHARESFDLVHHLTLGVVRHPSFMGRLGAPFLLGPLGGGERTPWRLRRGYGIRGLIMDTARDLANWTVRINPLMHETFRLTEVAYVKTLQSRSVIPRKFWDKVQCQMEIGVDSSRMASARLPNKGTHDLRILYAGRFLYWKGMHLGLAAFAQLLQVRPKAVLSLIGTGPDKKHWRSMVERLGISEQVKWTAWVDQIELNALYAEHDVVLFPSLHDSSGNAALEAMSHGLPIVCLDLGGPSVIVNHTCGIVIRTNGKSSNAVIAMLADSLIGLAEDRELRLALGKGALRRSKEFSWRDVVRNVYSPSS